MVRMEANGAKYGSRNTEATERSYSSVLARNTEATKTSVNERPTRHHHLTTPPVASGIKSSNHPSRYVLCCMAVCVASHAEVADIR